MADKPKDIPKGGWKATDSEGNSVTYDKRGEVVGAKVDGKVYGPKSHR